MNTNNNKKSFHRPPQTNTFDRMGEIINNKRKLDDENYSDNNKRFRSGIYKNHQRRPSTFHNQTHFNRRQPYAHNQNNFNGRKRFSANDRLKQIRSDQSSNNRNFNAPVYQDHNFDRKYRNEERGNINSNFKIANEQTRDRYAAETLQEHFINVENKTKSNEVIKTAAIVHRAQPSSLDERLMSMRTQNIFSQQFSDNFSIERDTPNYNVERCFPDNTSNINDSEMMDTTDIQNKLLSNLEEVRKNIIEKANFDAETSIQKIIFNEASDMKPNKNICKEIYVVVDTNIFISHIPLLKKLLELKMNEVVRPIVFIPWIVIQELDYLKEDNSNSLKKAAYNALAFINKHLVAKDSTLKGQSITDALKNKLTSNNCDDAVVSCGLQIKENKNLAYILSNDINLRNKGIISGIDSYGSDEILTKLDPYSEQEENSTPNIIFEVIRNIKAHFGHLLSFVILSEIKVAYGSVWSKMIQSPPWTLEECLKLFRKYWMAVFSFKMQKQCKNKIESFICLLENELENENFKNSLVNIGFELCIYLKNGYSKYEKTIDECIKSIEKENLNLK